MSRSLNILFASHTYMGGPFVVGSHHLAREMSRMGHKVFHLSTPISPFHLLKIKNENMSLRFKNWLAGGDKVNDVVNYVPMSLVPWAMAKKIRKNLVLSTLVPGLNRKMNQFGFDNRFDITFIDQISLCGVSDHIQSDVTVYRATDLYSDMLNDSALNQIERQIAQRADGIVGTSLPVVEHLRKYAPSKPHLLLENGVDYNHFSQIAQIPAELEPIRGIKAIYVGAIDERIDLNAFKLLAEANPKWKVIIIGPCSKEHAERLKADNIMLLGSKRYEEIPFYLNHCDIALLPLSDHPANDGRSPMKLYEYAASGLPVVSRMTSELLRRAEPFIFFYSDAEQIAVAARRAVEQKKSLSGNIQSSALNQSWTSKAQQLIDFALRLSPKFSER
ncbi:glycosyltransferase [Paenibacillus tarimensis]